MKHYMKLVAILTALFTMLAMLTLTACQTGMPAEGETKPPFVNPHSIETGDCLVHTLENEVCTTCGWEYQVSEGLEIGVDTYSGQYLVLGRGECTDTQIYLPTTHEGTPVMGVAIGAFTGDETLTHVVIPEGMTVIGDSAFSRCSKLVSAEIPSTVQNLNRALFEGCFRLTSVNLPEGITSIPDSLFSGCSSLKSITIPSTVTNLHGWAFKKCLRLTEITIPEGVTEIGNGAFEGCRDLTTLHLPKTLTTLSGTTFKDCESLTDVHYSGNIAQWCSVRIDFQDASPTMLAENFYVEGALIEGDIILPEGITAIGSFTLAGLRNVTSVTVPASVASIGDNAFKDCEKLAYLVLQGSTHAGSNPFPNTAVKHIYLTDTREDALSYIAYWAGACKSAGAEFHYGDAWEYDENGVPRLKEE